MTDYLSDTLSQKKQKLDQLKERVKQQEAILKLQERKVRTRRLIELGGLIAKAQLDHLETKTLYGALLDICQHLNINPATQERWAHQGGAAFAHEAPKTTAVMVRFEEKPTPETRTRLRALGLKWNALRQEWQGRVLLSQLQETLAHHPAVIEEVKEAPFYKDE